MFVDAIAHNDPRMKNVYFDMTSVAGLGDWKSKADLIVKRMHQIGISRLLHGSDAPVPGNYPEEAIKRWHQLPLTPAEFRAIETNIAPFLTPDPS